MLENIHDVKLLQPVTIICDGTTCWI